MIKSVRKHREAGDSSEKSEKTENDKKEATNYRPTDEYLLTPQSLASDGYTNFYNFL